MMYIICSYLAQDIRVIFQSAEWMGPADTDVNNDKISFLLPFFWVTSTLVLGWILDFSGVMGKFSE